MFLFILIVRGHHLVADDRRRLVGGQVERVLGTVDGEVGVEHLRELVLLLGDPGELAG